MISLPTNRDENWRYANLRPLTKARAEAIPSGETPELSRGPFLAGYQQWTYVDARHVAHSDVPPAEDVALRLDAREAGAAFAAMLDDSLATAGVDFALARINAARGEEVLHIAVPEGGHASIDVAFVASVGAALGTSYPRLQVQLARNARLNLIERHLSATSSDSAINAAVDVSVGAGAELTHIRFQDVANGGSCFDTLVAHIGERASYRLHTVALGGLTSRSTMFIKLAGRAARCELTAATVANGIQTHDVFAEIDHAAPETVTRELFRGIATERGKLAFNGKIIVREEAHESDSEQSLKSLLTGSGAEASARPQLEIYTDRVRAAHGATTGKLDDQMLFYLLSRGIDRGTAQSLLQWAFIEDAISRVTPATLREHIERAIVTQLSDVASLDGLLVRP